MSYTILWLRLMVWQQTVETHFAMPFGNIYIIMKLVRTATHTHMHTHAVVSNQLGYINRIIELTPVCYFYELIVLKTKYSRLCVSRRIEIGDASFNVPPRAHRKRPTLSSTIFIASRLQETTTMDINFNVIIPSHSCRFVLPKYMFRSDD